MNKLPNLMLNPSFKKRISNNLLFFNEAVEYYNRFNKEDLIFTQEIQKLSPNQLRDQMLNELNNLRQILANHPDLKLNKLNEQEREQYSKFIKFYSICPICGDLNHYHNLKKFYFDEANQNIKNKLLKFMNTEKKEKKLKSYNIDIGIPCCKCFKEFLEKK